MKIPWSLPNIEKKDMQEINRVLDSGWFSMGPEVKRFEQKTASYLDIDHAVAVNDHVVLKNHAGSPRASAIDNAIVVDRHVITNLNIPRMSNNRISADDQSLPHFSK